MRPLSLVSAALAAALALALMPAAAMAAPCREPANAQAMRAEVIALANHQRKTKGLAPLAEDPALSRAAQAHACDNAAVQRMSHQGSDGSSLPKRMSREGYAFREAAENVAAGFFDAPSVMSGWMQSKGHRKNILGRNLRDIGIGVAVGQDGQVYWTMDLGRAD